MIVDKDTFFSLQSKIADIPFMQSKGWHDTAFQSVLDKLVYFVNTTDDPRICCFGYLSKRKFFGNMLAIDGIARKKDVNTTELRTFFKSIVDEGYDMIDISDVSQYSAEFEVGIRRAGFVHPFGLSLCPMTLMVNLQAPFTFHRKWRSHVRNSVSCGNFFYPVEEPTRTDAEEFVRMFGELKDRKKLRYSCNADSIYHMVSNGFKLFFMKNKDGENIAGRLEYICGKNVCDVYAANTNQGLANGAVYHLQEEILKYLAEHKYKEFDYGMIPPSNNHMDDIYIAKRYSGGHPIGLNGQWQYCKSLKKKYLISLYTFYLHHSQLY